MKIVLTDNNIGDTSAAMYDRTDIAALFSIADKPLAQLCQENENLLIFPYSLGDWGDNIGDSPILSLQSTSSPDKVTITTGNVMGFLGVGDHQIKIRSRFDHGPKDYFLHYMLQKVMCFNLIDLQHTNEPEDVFDLLMFMFPYFLRNALQQGIYREYQRFEHDDANVRGPINVASFIKKDTPFAGKVAYSTREYSHDNSMTELIRHTIEYMSSKRFGKAVLNSDNEVKTNVSIIISATSSYDRAKRSMVIQQNLRHKVHPYFTSYTPLRSLCLQILRKDEVKYGEQENEICGILFDGAWLWEEYVNTLLCKKGFKHPRNKEHTGAIRLFKDGSGIRYPDFYKNDIVLDAKYKRMGSYEKVSEVDRNDIHQIITYMTVLNATKGGFIAPLTEEQPTVPTAYLNGTTDSTISIFGIEIAKAETFSSFVTAMEANEATFVNRIEA